MNCKCGKELSHKNKCGICNTCLQSAVCSCGVKIGRNSVKNTGLCQKCSVKNAISKRKFPDRFCEDCGIKLKSRNFLVNIKLCHKCSSKKQGIVRRGSNWVSKDRLCRCGQKIASSLKQNKSGLCITCSSALRKKKYKTGYFLSNKNNKEIYYASSYELLALKRFESSDFVISFDRCRLKIPYSYNGKIKKYFPDFELETNIGKAIFEVKAEWQLSEEQTLAKINAIKEYCKINNLGFEILTEKELFL